MISEATKLKAKYRLGIVDETKLSKDRNVRSVTVRYLIPIKIRAPLIFAHLACAKIKGSKFAQYECAKIKGKRKNATNE